MPLSITFQLPILSLATGLISGGQATVIEEGLRTAIRDLASQAESPPRDLEIPECEKLEHE